MEGIMEKFYLKDRDEVLSSLDVDSNQGLTSQEAQARLEKYGPNELQEKKGKSFFAKLIDQLLDPMVIILLAAAILSAFSGDKIETVITVSYTHLTLPTIAAECRSRWSPYH